MNHEKNIIKDLDAEISGILRKIEKNTPQELREEFLKMENYFRKIHFNELLRFINEIEDHLVKEIEFLLTEYHTPKKIICKKYGISFKKLQQLLNYKEKRSYDLKHLFPEKN